MSGPRVIGLTGSIGMGKSTVAAMFAEEGVPVWDADAAVHRLYAADGAGARALAPLVPAAVGAQGVDRAVLAAAIAADETLLPRIEALIHPLVSDDRNRFIAEAQAPLVLCDIPLLLEKGGFAPDHLVVVSAPEAMQRARVLARPGMSAARFEMIRARQMPDAQKRAKADFIIDTGQSLAATRAQVGAVLAKIRGMG